MNITIITTKKVRVPDLDVDGTQKKVKGIPQFKEDTEEVEHVFETHEHELAGSAATRFVVKHRIPAPPPEKEPTLAPAQDGSATFRPYEVLGRHSADKKFRLTTW